MTLRASRLQCLRGRGSEQCLDVSDRAWWKRGGEEEEEEEFGLGAVSLMEVAWGR
jgi:hypothetical protein